MTRDDTLRLARKAGLTVYEGDQDRVLFEGSIVAGLARLIELASAKEREACAMECEKQIKTFLSTKYAVNQPISSFKERFACKTCADAIRARSQQ